MSNLPAQYDHKIVEPKWHSYWEENAIHHWNETEPRENNFVVDTPPPTVSGILHMGHIFSYTQADIVARYMRMKGKNVFYPMGFDDNGLPTERLVEKVRKVRAQDMSREEFIKICEDVVKEAEDEFRRLFKSVALSVDWRQEYQTISAKSRKISQMSFLDIYHKDRAYRKLQPMYWDPVDQTALAQAEIEDKEFDSFMNDIKFTTEDGEDVVIATTRPELLVACVAVFYHPDDKRYQHLKGKNAITALFGVKVPIIADENVLMEKGTGLVMCCTFGDETDIKWWQSHNLPIRVVLNKYGKLSNMEAIGSDAWPSVNKEKALEHIEQIANKNVKQAREVVIELLKNEQLLLKQTAIKHFVKCAERSGAPLEIIPTYQWFIKILDQKEQLIEKARACNWYPDYMRIRIEQWINGLSWDWCVSRQRFFGVPFPVWYVRKESGSDAVTIVASKDQLPVNPINSLPKGFELLNDSDSRNIIAKATADYICDKTSATLFRAGEQVVITPEFDVMDTWATSSVSPQLSSGSINAEYATDLDRHKKLFPADIRPQAHEIIRTWAFYTIVKAHLHEDNIPWHNLMISGWCLASDKTKMSKSKGNVVTPVDLIEEKGADVVRFWASTSRLGADTAYSEDVLKIGKKLVNKLWNATKFAAIHLDKVSSYSNSAAEDVASGNISSNLDLWLLSKLKLTIIKATEEFERFEYCNARAAIEDFFWNDLCDNYLEMVKARVYGESDDFSKAQSLSAVYTIYHVLDAILRLFAPILPHITEELYSHIFAENHKKLGGSINARGAWPNAEDYALSQSSCDMASDAVSILNVVRKLKADRNLSMKTTIVKMNITSLSSQNCDFADIALDLKNVCNAEQISFNDNNEDTSAVICNSDGDKYKVVIWF